MIYLYLSNILPFLFKSIILSTFFFLQINSNLYAGVISYKANFEVSYAGDPSDVFPYGYPEAAKCRIIPLEINISISNDNIVSGEIINKYSEFNDYIPNRFCETFHAGKIKGKLDNRGKFKKAFVKHPTSSNNLYGLYRIDGTIKSPTVTFKKNHLFSYKKFKFKQINTSEQLGETNENIEETKESEKTRIKTDKNINLNKNSELGLIEGLAFIKVNAPHKNLNRCKEIPLRIILKIRNNKVTGEIVNIYKEIYDNVPAKSCRQVHSGNISGNIDNNQNFQNVTINFNKICCKYGASKIEGNLNNAKIVSRRPGFGEGKIEFQGFNQITTKDDLEKTFEPKESEESKIKNRKEEEEKRKAEEEKRKAEADAKRKDDDEKKRKEEEEKKNAED